MTKYVVLCGQQAPCYPSQHEALETLASPFRAACINENEMVQMSKPHKSKRATEIHKIKLSILKWQSNRSQSNWDKMHSQKRGVLDFERLYLILL